MCYFYSQRRAAVKSLQSNAPLTHPRHFRQWRSWWIFIEFRPIVNWSVLTPNEKFIWPILNFSITFCFNEWSIIWSRFPKIWPDRQCNFSFRRISIDRIYVQDFSKIKVIATQVGWGEWWRICWGKLGRWWDPQEMSHDVQCYYASLSLLGISLHAVSPGSVYLFVRYT